MSLEDNKDTKTNKLIFILIAAIIVVVLVFVGKLTLSGGPKLAGLTVTEWEKYLLVLVRAENDHEFLVSNEGEASFRINSINYLYSTGPDLLISATVNKSMILTGDRSVEIIKSETLVGEDGFLINSGEDFTIIAFFQGEKLGTNKLNGIRIEFTLDGITGYVDLMTPETFIDVQ